MHKKNMRKIYKNFNLINVISKSVDSNTSMLVEDGKILEIGSTIAEDAGVEVVDLSGKFVMPGLIDCHTHVFLSGTADPLSKVGVFKPVDWVMEGITNLEKLISHGVTYIRDVGDLEHWSLDFKKYLLSGRVKGPEMVSAGVAVTMTGGHGHSLSREADGVDEVRKAVREQLKAGADLIKVISTGGVMTPGVDVNAYQFNVDELTVAVEEAHKAGRKVCTHAHGTQGIKNSIIAGIDSIEHATILDDEAIDMLLEYDTFIVPTLAAPHNIVVNGVAAGIPEYAVRKAEEVSKEHGTGIKKAFDRGVKIAMGTDAGTPLNTHGESAMQELELLAGIGIEPMEVIKISTINSAVLIGVEKTHGSLEVGKVADFLVLPKNPIDEISNVRAMEAVYKRGNKVK